MAAKVHGDDLLDELKRGGGPRAVPTGRASLDGRRPDPEAVLQHNSLDDDGYNPSTYGKDLIGTGTFRAAASGELYNAANSSHGNLADLGQQQGSAQPRESKVSRPVSGQCGKPNRSESQSLDDKPIDLASLLPRNPPGAEASRRAEERVFRANSGDWQLEEDHEHEYRRTDYYNPPSEHAPARQSSHLDLQAADN